MKLRWLEDFRAKHRQTVRSVSTALSRFPACETWKKTPLLLKLRRYRNARRALAAIEEGRTVVDTFPTYLTIDPFSACNLKCPLCPTGNRANTLKKDLLALDVFRHIVDEMGTYLYNIDLFNWGEPLLNEDIYEMIAYAHRRHVITSVSTNFHFFDEESAERMVRSGLDYLILSIDGATQEVYEKYRVGGNLAKVLKNVRTLVDTRKRLGAKGPYIFWQYLVFRHNEHEIEQARELAMSLGADQFQTEVAYLPVATRAEGDYWIPRQEQYTRYSLMELEGVWAAQEAQDPAEEERANREREERRAHKRLRLAMEAAGLTPEAPQPAERRRERRRLENCSWLYITTTVNADAKVYPCCVTMRKEDLFGDLGAGDSITSLWNGDAYQAARAFSTRGVETGIETVCHRCPLAPVPGQLSR